MVATYATRFNIESHLVVLCSGEAPVAVQDVLAAILDLFVVSSLSRSKLQDGIPIGQRTIPSKSLPIHHSLSS